MSDNNWRPPGMAAVQSAGPEALHSTTPPGVVRAVEDIAQMDLALTGAASEDATPKRRRGRPRKDGPPALPKPSGGVPGRPVGYRVPTFADLNELTLEDFSFVRGVFNGMSEQDAFLRFYANIHFDSRGEPVIPHGLTINARFAYLERRILETANASEDKSLQHAAKVLNAPMPTAMSDKEQRDNLEAIYQRWFDNLPEDQFTERELPEAFAAYLEDNDIQVSAEQTQEVSRATTIDRRVKALNDLQTVLAYLPRPDAKTSIWLASPVHKALAGANIQDMRQLVSFISFSGRNWHRQIGRIGPVRAKRIEAWLGDHAATLGSINRAGAAWRPYKPLKTGLTALQRAPEVAELVYATGSAVATVAEGQLTQREGIAPLELLRVPVALDGHNGLFRNPGPNLLGARNDMHAICIWLDTFLTAQKTRTFEAYRREVERFYVWCLSEGKVAISSVSLSHAIAYQLFLRSIPAKYISKAGVTRDDPRWRPWRGQLDQRSQSYALTVIKVMMKALCTASYLTGNAFHQIKSTATVERTMDVSRSLNEGDLQWVTEALNRLDASHKRGVLTAEPTDAPQGRTAQAPSPARLGPRFRRLKLILNLLLATGIRLDELAKASARDMTAVPSSSGETPDQYLLRVVGKGKKARTVVISASIYEMVSAHHQDVEAAASKREGESSPRLEAFRIERPLIASLEAAPLSNDKAIKRGPSKKNRPLALSAKALYKTLKGFFKTNAMREIRRIEALRRVLVARQKKAGTALKPEQYAFLANEIRALDAEEMTWKRRAEFSTHWLRHTYAKEVLRVNPSDSGLKLAQQFLGHASITTTGIYVKQDDTAKIKAARLIFPKGV